MAYMGSAYSLKIIKKLNKKFTRFYNFMDFMGSVYSLKITKNRIKIYQNLKIFELIFLKF